MKHPVHGCAVVSGREPSHVEVLDHQNYDCGDDCPICNADDPPTCPGCDYPVLSKARPCWRCGYEHPAQ